MVSQTEQRGGLREAFVRPDFPLERTKGSQKRRLMPNYYF